jgi:hypothetical protein
MTEHRLTECHVPFDRKFIQPKSPFNRTPFDRKFILPKGHMTDFYSENGHLTESTLDKKCHLTEKKLRTRSFDRKFISSKAFSENDHLTESFRSNELSVICHFGHLTSFSIFIFGQITIFQIFSVKRPFDKFCFRPKDFFR